MKSLPKVSVILVTYNHEKYIREALDSICLQDYEGPIEILIAEDKSTDGTLAVIKAYPFDFDRFEVRYLESENNCGITKNYQRAFAACSGDYIAPLEGDDCWTSPARLSMLISELERSRDLVMVCNNYVLFNADSCKFSTRTPVDVEGLRRFDSRHLIFDNLPGNFSACVYRASIVRRLPDALFEIKSYDWIVNICLGMHGMIGYVSQPLSIYRLHQSSTWSGMDIVSKLESQLEVVECYDLLTKGKFRDEFKQLQGNLKAEIVRLQISDQPALKAIYRNRFLRGFIRVSLLCTPLLFIRIGKLLFPPLLTERIKGMLN